jgi:type I restriction enzyme S subunit
MIEMADKKLKVGNVPPLRFPEFEGEWETKKLHEVMDFKVTNSFSRENLNYEVGTVKNIHYGDIHTKFQTLFDITNETVPYINEELNIEKIAEQNYCEEGDIIFADASEDLLDVGKSIEIVNLNKEKLLSGLHTLLARPEKGIFCLGFNGHLFKSNFVRTQIQKEAQGTKVLSINTGRISKIDLSYPDIKEQAKITLLLSLIDERIQTQNKIIEQYETLIKGLCFKLILQQNPNRKLKDCVECNSSSLTESEVKERSGIYPVYGANGIISFINDFQINGEAILMIKDGAGVGQVQFSSDKFSVIGTLNYLIAKSNINLKYIFFSLKFFNFDKYKVGSGIPHIYFKDYGESFIFCPSIVEQQNIEKILSYVEDKILIEKMILQKYVLQKNHLLQQLFI